MRPKLSSDLQNDQISIILENLRSSGIFFTDWNKNLLDQFRDHFRFLTFNTKQQLTRRNEPVDFLGIILKGSANIIMDHKSQSVMGTGDVLGCMSLFRFPGSCEVQQFDIYAKEPGVMALMRRDDLKHLAKREPELNLQIQRALSLNLLSMVNLQYSDNNYACLLPQSITPTTNKKLLLYLDHLALTKQEITNLSNKNAHKRNQSIPNEQLQFRSYWNLLESRQKRLFIQFCQQVELEKDQILIREGQRGNHFYIVVYGEVQNLESKQLILPGQLIGFKNFMTQEGFRYNYQCKQRTVLIRMTRSYFEDMLYMSPVSGSVILAMLTKYECDEIRRNNDHKNEKLMLCSQVQMLVEKLKTTEKPIPRKDQQTLPQLMDNYFELNINKTKLLSLDLIDKEQAQSDIAPLYLLDTFKELVAKRGFQSSEIKDRKDPMVQSGMSWFMREKVDEQKRESQKKRQEERKLRKMGDYIPKSHQIQDENIGNDGDIFEDLNNDYYLLQAELDKANEYIYLLEEQTQKLKDDARMKLEENQILITKIRKNEMQRQLVRLSRFQDDYIDDQYLKKRVTLFDTFKQQADEAKIFKGAIQAADKMIISMKV